MKTIKIMLLASSLIFTGVAIMSCGGHKHEQSGQGKEYTSKYICPMHCEGSGSESPGTCPVCGMDYVKNHEH